MPFAIYNLHGRRPDHPFGPNIGPCGDPVCRYCEVLGLNEEHTTSLLDMQGKLIAQLKRNIRMERNAAKMARLRANRLEGQCAQMREKLIAMGCNPVDVDVEPPMH